MSDGATLKYVIYMAIAILLVGLLMPTALDSIANATGTNWNPAVVTVFKVLLPILAVLSVALYLMPKEIKGKIGL